MKKNAFASETRGHDVGCRVGNIRHGTSKLSGSIKRTLQLALRLRPGALALAALAACLSPVAHAGPPWKVSGGFTTDWDNLNVEVQPLAKNIYLLHGSGGNTVASIGADGTFLVDTEFAQAAPKLKEALHKLGAGPVRYVISTHFHPDHMGGDAAFKADGAIVVAQEKCRARMLVSQHSYFWGYNSKPVKLEDAPNLTFDKKISFYFNGDDITATHLGRPAHTDCDTVVFFPTANVIHMGDLLLDGLYPYIDVATGANLDGYFPALDDALARINDKTIVVPGHGSLTDRRGLQAYRDMLKVVRDRVADQIAKGATLDQIIATQPSREFDDKYASDRVGPDGFITMVYQGMTGKFFDYRAAKAR